MNFRLSKHVETELRLRGIPPQFLDQVMANPQQVVPERGNKKAYQSQMDFGSGKLFLLRAIVDDTISPAVVVTVYRTAKIDKYWRKT
jgi:hypothetical protein